MGGVTAGKRSLPTALRRYSVMSQFDPDAGPDPLRVNRVRRRPSIGRILFWAYAVGLPLVSVGAGVALLIVSNRLDIAVQTYRNAPPCPAPPNSSTCYQLLTGTLVTFSISRGKTGDTANMTLQLPDGNQSTWAKTSWAQEDALKVGVPLRAEIYQGAITAVWVGDVGISTKDSPTYQQGDLREAAIVIPVIGLVITAVTLFPMRRRMRSQLVAALMIDTNLPIADQAMLLRQALLMDQPDPTSQVTPSRPVTVNLPMTVRPRPIPAGYPWWVALIATGIGVPSLLLRMRTPGSIAQVVLAATVIAMLAGVVLHWLYRHRRMVVVDDMTVRRVSLFGASRVIPRSDIASLAFPIIMTMNPRVAVEPRLLILDANGRCLLRLTRYYPTDDDAAQLAAALRVPVPANSSRPTTASRLRRTIPGAVSWTEAHPYLTSLVLAPPILVAVGLFVWTLNGFK
jgi:hypothetical protein